MKIFIILSLFLSILCSTAYIRNITFNSKFNVIYYGDGYRAGNVFFFRMPILEKDTMEVSLCTESYTYMGIYYTYTHLDFDVSTAFFKGAPTDEELLNLGFYQSVPWDSEVFDEAYSTFNYVFDTLEDKDYLGVKVEIKNNVYYLDITVLSATGLIWLFILIGAIAFIIVVVGAIFGVRKYRR